MSYNYIAFKNIEDNPDYYEFSDSLSLKNLSVLYKVVSMAGYLGISISEFILANQLLNLGLFKVKVKEGIPGISPPELSIATEDILLFS